MRLSGIIHIRRKKSALSRRFALGEKRTVRSEFALELGSICGATVAMKRSRKFLLAVGAGVANAVDAFTRQEVVRTRSSWSHFSHDADIGIVGVGATKAEAFRQAPAVVTDPSRVKLVHAVPIFCQAQSDEMLLVEWLNALVYEMAVRAMPFADFAVEIEAGELRAMPWGARRHRSSRAGRRNQGCDAHGPPGC